MTTPVTGPTDARAARLAGIAYRLAQLGDDTMWHPQVPRSEDGICHGAPTVTDGWQDGFVVRAWKSHPQKVEAVTFIAGAPDDVRWLLADIAALTEQLASAREDTARLDWFESADDLACDLLAEAWRAGRPLRAATDQCRRIDAVRANDPAHDLESASAAPRGGEGEG